MNKITVTHDNKNIQSIPLNWQDNADVQKLLDVVVEILAEEYIEAVKHNPEIFSRTQRGIHESRDICSIFVGESE